MNEESTTKYEFPTSIEIEVFDIPENAEPSSSQHLEGL
jgi:hypothetical protein